MAHHRIRAAAVLAVAVMLSGCVQEKRRHLPASETGLTTARAGMMTATFTGTTAVFVDETRHRVTATRIPTDQAKWSVALPGGATATRVAGGPGRVLVAPLPSTGANHYLRALHEHTGAPIAAWWLPSSLRILDTAMDRNARALVLAYDDAADRVRLYVGAATGGGCTPTTIAQLPAPWSGQQGHVPADVAPVNARYCLSYDAKLDEYVVTASSTLLTTWWQGRYRPVGATGAAWVGARALTVGAACVAAREVAVHGGATVAQVDGLPGNLGEPCPCDLEILGFAPSGGMGVMLASSPDACGIDVCRAGNGPPWFVSFHRGAGDLMAHHFSP